MQVKRAFWQHYTVLLLCALDQAEAIIILLVQRFSPGYASPRINRRYTSKKQFYLVKKDNADTPLEQ